MAKSGGIGVDDSIFRTSVAVVSVAMKVASLWAPQMLPWLILGTSTNNLFFSELLKK